VVVNRKSPASNFFSASGCGRVPRRGNAFVAALALIAALYHSLPRVHQSLLFSARRGSAFNRRTQPRTPRRPDPIACRGSLAHLIARWPWPPPFLSWLSFRVLLLQAFLFAQECAQVVSSHDAASSGRARCALRRACRLRHGQISRDSSVSRASLQRPRTRCGPARANRADWLALAASRWAAPTYVIAALRSPCTVERRLAARRGGSLVAAHAGAPVDRPRIRAHFFIALRPRPGHVFAVRRSITIAYAVPPLGLRLRRA